MNAKTDTHTPLPWAAAPHSNDGGCVRDANGKSVLSVHWVEGGEDAFQAQCNFIVRAVNAHDALVAALEALLQVYEPRVAITGRSAVLWSQARAALAAAKGEA